VEGLAMEAVGIFNVHFVYFMAKWYTLYPFGTFGGHSVHFSDLVCCNTEKNLATLVDNMCAYQSEAS
jgi:hypothetical protein